MAVAALLAVLSGLAAVVGGWAWWQVRSSRLFWLLARAAQIVAVTLALVSGLAAALGRRPDDGLFWVYGLVPVVAGFVAEQLRVLSAETVLDARGLPDAQALRARSEAEQRSVALAIVRREIGIVALAAAVVCILALRAIGTAPGL